MKEGRAGVWEATVPLAEGVHHYKFVIDGGRWVNDVKYSDKELEKGDNYGGVNSAVMVGFDARKLPPARADHVNVEALRHVPGDLADVNVVDEEYVRFRVRTQARDVERVEVVMRDGEVTTPAPLFKVGTESGLDVFAGLAKAPGKRVEYWFRVSDGSDAESLGKGEFRLEVKPAFETPDWARDAVWYQVFPERFRNGETANDPEGVKRWQAKWFATLPGEAAGEGNFYKGRGNVWQRRYGGDVQGLREALPYLKRLGVNAIYLNPVFEAESMHKYDATDFRHIDDNFGVKGDLAKLEGETDDPATWKWSDSDKVFLDFVAEAHRQGFKVVIDGVFNHVGRNHWAFQDVLKKGRASKYADWFDVRDWNRPIKYIAWDKGGEPTSDGALPVFKKDEKLGLVRGPREHVFAITRRWLAPDGDPSRGVDGWRLDVPGDIPHPFWVEWRKVVKGAKPDAYIVGEIWDWAQPWLRGDQFDAVMNYRFADAAQQFFVNRERAIAPSEFASRLSQMVNAYPLQVSMVQQNLFDSHDTDRLASMFVNPDLAYDAANRLQDNGPNYSARKPNAAEWARMKQAVVCQMAFVGAPMIYYGDEAGMWGPDDPSNRMPMVWEDMQPYDDPEVAFKGDLFEHYRRVIAVREGLKALRWGYFRPVVVKDGEGVLAFARTLNDQAVYVVMNRSAQEREVEVPVDGVGEMVDWMDGESAEVVVGEGGRPVARVKKGARPVRGGDGKIRVALGPYGSAILSAVAAHHEAK
jgi:glycosidase